MPETTVLDFHHQYIAGNELTFLMLHGTGGDEHDLLDMGRQLAPGAALLSPRGKVLESGMPRFFRRLAMGVFDEKDVRFRAQELAAFVKSAAGQYGFDERKVVAAGYSNGANIAAALLLLHPEVLAGAVLFRPMVPVVPEKPPVLTGVPVWIGAGRHDPYSPVEQTGRLQTMLAQAGAEVDVNWSPGGHELNSNEVRNAAGWVARRFKQ